MERAQNIHASGEELLGLLDGELPDSEARRVRAHLEACWQCRESSEELQRGIADALLYRREVLQGHLPRPPSPWAGLHAGMAAIDAATQPSWAERLSRALRRWLPATAALAACAAAVYEWGPELTRNEPAAVAVPAPAVQPRAVETAPERALPGPGVPTLPQRAPQPEATPGDELRVWRALRALNADLGEPVEVKRESGRVVVSATGLSPARRDRLEEALDSLPRVELAWTASPAAETRPGHADVRVSARAGLSAIEERLGGRAALDRVADRVLLASDDLLARAHALHRLAERFPPTVEARLSAEEQDMLAALVQEHRQAFAEQSVELKQSVRPVLEALEAAVPGPAGQQPVSSVWQEHARQSLAVTQQLDRVLTALLAGEDAGPGEALAARVAAALAEVR